MSVQVSKNPACLKVSSPASAFADMLRVDLPWRVSESFWALPGGSISTGSLPDHYAAAYTSARVAYTVYSYLTPIAWRLESGQWIMPGIRYSVTTSKTQSKIFEAIRLIQG